MVDFIASIYQYSQLIPALKEIANSCYLCEYLNVQNSWSDIAELLSGFCKKTSETNPELGKTIFNNLKTAGSYMRKESNNFLLMGDTILETIDYMYEAISLCGHIDVADGNYRLLSSRSGFLSLDNTFSGKCYHSHIDPVTEALVLAKQIYSPDKFTYNLLGCGLGYLPWHLYCLSDGSAVINIYHTNSAIVQYALDYGVLGWIPENNLNIIIEEDNIALLSKYTENSDDKTHFFFSLPDIMDNIEEEYQPILDNFNMLNITVQNFGMIQKINHSRNTYNVPQDIRSYIPRQTDEWIIVVAGPSLDDSLSYLQENIGKQNVICASTVLNKLLKNGIQPDCVAVLDPQERTFHHFDNLESCTTPLILYSTANWRFSEYYDGPKYVVTEELIYQPGSTVSSFCIELALFFGAKKIHFLGLDLAYPGGQSHTKGTMDYHETNVSKMINVPCVSGGLVPTTNEFRLYKTEIENIIANAIDVQFINHSKIGAHFNGSVAYSAT